MSRNILATTTIMSMIVAFLMNILLRWSGNSRPSPMERRISGTLHTSGKDRPSIMRTAVSALIVVFIALLIAALMSGCRSESGSVMSLSVDVPVIGVEIDFVLSVPGVGVLSSPPTSQPSSMSDTARSE